MAKVVVWMKIGKEMILSHTVKSISTSHAELSSGMILL